MLAGCDAGLCPFFAIASQLDTHMLLVHARSPDLA